MKDNRAVRMLKAAEEGGYGVIGVVSVSYLLIVISWPIAQHRTV
jgi:hypothetical protein